MVYKVVITDKAKKRVAEIFDHFAYELFSPVSAKKYFDRILSAAESLSTFPNRYAVLHFEEEGLRAIRRILVGRYSVFYKVEEEKKQVLILTVLSSASDFEKKLIEEIEDNE